MCGRSTSWAAPIHICAVCDQPGNCFVDALMCARVQRSTFPVGTSVNGNAPIKNCIRDVVSRRAAGSAQEQPPDPGPWLLLHGPTASAAAANSPTSSTSRRWVSHRLILDIVREHSGRRSTRSGPRQRRLGPSFGPILGLASLRALTSDQPRCVDGKRVLLRRRRAYRRCVMEALTLPG